MKDYITAGPFTYSSILSSTAIMTLLISAALIIFMYAFCRRQRDKFIHKALRKSQCEKEILQAQVEVQNSALQHIGDKLQNHVGQLLSVAHINLNMAEENQQLDENKGHIAQANEMVSYSITDLRVISKSIGVDFIKEFNLIDNLSVELIRIRESSRLATELTISGKKYPLGNDKEIVLFRISQEIFSKILQHSNATNILVQLRYTTDSFIMILSEKGVGFGPTLDPNEIDKDNGGPEGIDRKAEIIGGQFVLRSVPGHGTTFEIFLPANSS